MSVTPTIKNIHDSVFTPETRAERYKLGQFITEPPFDRKLAELVVDVFDKHQTLTLYAPCVGTGIIECALIDVLIERYGKERTLDILKHSFKVADLDTGMRRACAQVLKLHIQDIYGPDVRIGLKVEHSDLETDSFDLSGMLVYGNYPFNKGTDYNYIARLIRKQIDSGLSHAVIMTNATLLDKNKVQSKKILGEEFYSKVKELYSTDDFKDVAVKIAVFEYDMSREVKKETLQEGFITLEQFGVKPNYVHDMVVCRATRFKDKTPIRSNKYEVNNSVLYIQPRDIHKANYVYRLPLETSPSSSHEHEVYDKWIKDRGALPKGTLYQSGLISGTRCASTMHLPVGYISNTLAVLDDIMLFTGDTLKLGVVGLILQSTTFKTKLYQLFPVWQKVQRALQIRKLKTLPIPIETEDNKLQFKRLYEIGQKLIIENTEDKVLREEADSIIEKLYEELT